MQAPLGTSISRTEKISIIPVVEHFDEQANLCAINWFDLKIPWMYQLYGLIASVFVGKVSGRLYFKGNLIRQIEGPAEHKRENLLIVCYPGARKFLDLLDFKIFQMVSMLRLAAVNKFVFGFMENIIDETGSPGAEDKSFHKEPIYLVHHFRGGANWLRDKHQALFTSAQQHHMPVYFCGLTNAHIVREKSGQQQKVEFFMDGILLFAARSEADIENFTKDDLYRNFIHNNIENSLYLFSRMH